MRSLLEKLSQKILKAGLQSAMLESYFQKFGRELDILKVIQAQTLRFNQNHDPKDLSEVEFRVFSQYGEDGIIQYLVSKININESQKVCLELGCENFHEANTRLLLELNNWKAVVFDGSQQNIAMIKSKECAWRLNLEAHCSFITRENINLILKNMNLPNEIGLISIDIDGNDYWVWEALDIISPIIVVIEYNGLLGAKLPIVVPYDPNFNRFKAHYSGVYWGASIKALELLASKKGYVLIGSNSAGCNAFFVKEDYAKLFNIQSAAQAFREPLSRDARDETGQFIFVDRDKQRQLISELDVINIERGLKMKIKEAL